MRFNILVIGEASFDDRLELVSKLYEKGILVGETSHRMHIEIEDHDLVVDIMQNKLGIKLKKISA